MSDNRPYAMPDGLARHDDGSVDWKATCHDSPDEGHLAFALLLFGTSGTCRPTDPIDGSSWSNDSHSWRCTLSTPLGRLSTTFTMGRAHGGRLPSVCELLECLAMDARFSEDYPTLESAIDSDMCGDPEHEDTPRRAKKMIAACQKAKTQLERLFGPLWTPTSQSFDDATTLANKHPKLRLGASPGFSMAHWACAMGEASSFAAHMSFDASKSQRIDMLQSCRQIAEAREHGDLIQMCEALIERESISSELPSSATAKSKAAKTI